MISNERGYTLIELLVVLMIISIIGSITLIYIQSPYSSFESNHTISQFENDLYYAQQLAISNGIPAYFYINSSRNFYAIRQDNQNVFEQSFNANVSFERGSLDVYDIKFLANGNISKSGTLFMNVGTKSYAIVFLIGKGRFYFEER
ncbi:competence type IV pilus minor pilin ComGD [Alkalihalobacterium elongatum]|uniref:competence type IV pilus minor pilin ComGD n=1 Tax=Alkalihalobacterium elongatum TaxID=2675466 RepID=UPI001C1F7F4D|nr:competence type IV pilus minor pilin ComGD [Alkalihalobacterium elongatum]